MAEDVKTVTQAEIEVKEYPECVRIRKGMYLPNKDHSVFEIVDNSVDEYAAGRCSAIAVAIIDGKVTVEDNGGGIPIAKHKKFPGLTQAEVAYTVLHAGGKFGGEGSYKTSTGGLHGVGASVVNALSKRLSLTVKTGGNKYQAVFEKGIIVENMHLIEEGLDPADTGTEVSYELDDTIWNEEEKFDLKRIKKRLQQLAYLNPGLLFYLYIDSDDKDGKRVKLEEQFEFPNGLKSYIDKLTDKKVKITDVVSLSTKTNEIEVNVAFAYSDSYSEEIYSFCNNINTEGGGDHLTGFKTGFTKAINDYITSSKTNLNFESEDTREGLVAIISIKMINAPEFEGQGKGKLKSPLARNAVKQAVEEAVFEYLDHNPDQAKVIIEKINSASKAREAAIKARNASRKVKDLIEGGTPGKLASCSEKDPAKCEIYFVEGDSAAGSAKQGRDRKTQAILPVFGKILNVEKKRLHVVLSSEKIRDMVKALKCGIGDEFDINKIRYHKIILMSDADVDGYHIRILNITFFYRYMREVIEKGMLYAAMPPLYKITFKGSYSDEQLIAIYNASGKEYNPETDEKALKKIKKTKIFYAYSDEQKNIMLSLLNENDGEIQRYKGLGEMNPEQLWETTMNPEDRRLLQITLEDAELADEAISICMGEVVEPRRNYIVENALYAKIDA